MRRTTITFDDEIYQKIEGRMKKNEIPSVAECIRELIDLALRIEEAAAKSKGKEDEMDPLQAIQTLKNLLKNNLAWSLETRLLTRFLVESQDDISQSKKAEILEKYKESASNFVNGLMNEENI